MHILIYFLIGLVISIVLIKIIFPQPKIVKIHPTFDNYKDIVYVDENGKLYKYDLIKI
jgi:hypothetical protein